MKPRYHWQRISAALLCMGMAHAKINRKMESSIPCKILTHEDVVLKLCTHDYVGEHNYNTNFVTISFIGAFPQIGEIEPFCDNSLSCPCLFSILRPNRTARPIFTRHSSNVFPRKKIHFGVRKMGEGDVIWGNMPPPTSFPQNGVLLMSNFCTLIIFVGTAVNTEL